MFNKEAVVIATAAGGGRKSTMKDIKDGLSYWGVPKIYSFGKAVASTNWHGVSAKKNLQIEKQIKALAAEINKNTPKRKSHSKMPGLKVFFLFHAMRLMQKHIHFSKIDYEYWKAQGWLTKARPWKLVPKTSVNIHSS